MSEYGYSCVVCGNAFLPYHNRKNQKTCSKDCQHTLHFAPDPPVQKRCAICGEPFKTGIRGRARDRMTCSTKCEEDRDVARRREYYSKNKSDIRAKSLAYYAANKERCRAKMRTYLEKNITERRRYWKEWYLANKEKVQERQQNVSDMIATLRKSNPEFLKEFDL